MKKQKPEKQIQQEILQYLGGLPSCWAVKVIVSSKRGCPDVLCCYKGNFLGIEVKIESGKMTELQDYQTKMIRVARGYTLVARSVKDVRQTIEAIDYNEGIR